MEKIFFICSHYATNEYPEEAKQDNKNSSCPGLECVPHPQEFENGALSKAETSNENPGLLCTAFKFCFLCFRIV